MVRSTSYLNQTRPQYLMLHRLETTHRRRLSTQCLMLTSLVTTHRLRTSTRCLMLTSLETTHRRWTSRCSIRPVMSFESEPAQKTMSVQRRRQDHLHPALPSQRLGILNPNSNSHPIHRRTTTRAQELLRHHPQPHQIHCQQRMLKKLRKMMKMSTKNLKRMAQELPMTTVSLPMTQDFASLNFRRRQPLRQLALLPCLQGGRRTNWVVAWQWDQDPASEQTTDQTWCRLM